MSTNQNSGSGAGRRGPRFSLTALLVSVAAVALGAVAVTAYGGSDSASSKGSGDGAAKLSAKEKTQFNGFRDCMAAEGVKVSPDGPPAESEKTDKMRAAFAKCGGMLPSDADKGSGGGAADDGAGAPSYSS